MKHRLLFLIIFLFVGVSFFVARGQSLAQQSEISGKDSTSDEAVVSALGFNANDAIVESSGLAISSFVENAVWTHNDSGQPNTLFLLATDGRILAQVELLNAKNSDWEAMTQFKIDGTSYLIVADVGDNGKRRDRCQLYLMQEPDFSNEIRNSANLPLKRQLKTTKIQFTYEDGPKDCEAVCVDVHAKQIWLVEKIFYATTRKKTPGVYVLPLSLEKNQKPLVAKRIADFPPRGVTGMAFSPDGKRLIIRNYANAHLYSRKPEQAWKDVVKKSKPVTVVLPLQRQGEAVCFTPDSQSVILTSEFKREPIWQVGLKQYFDQPMRVNGSGTSGALNADEQTRRKDN